MAPNEHPVWDVYNLLRTARLNVKYYSARLHSLRRCNFLIEIVLAITAPSSAIAGLWFWKYPLGQLTWKYFAIIAAICAIIKPFLKLVDRLQKFEETLTGYRTLDNDLQAIIIEIKQKKTYSEKLKKEFNKAFERKKAISTKEPEINIKTKLREICEAEVIKELPVSSFFIPEG